MTTLVLLRTLLPTLTAELSNITCAALQTETSDATQLGQITKTCRKLNQIICEIMMAFLLGNFKLFIILLLFVKWRILSRPGTIGIAKNIK